MKRSISSLLFVLLCFIPPILNYWPYQPPTRPEFHDDCERINKAQPLNYLGTNLTLTEEDDENILLCPGDAIGDLNATYIKIGECNLTVYHKDKVIWSKGRGDSLISKGKCSNDDYCFCVFALKRDGNLVLHQDEIYYLGVRRSGWSDIDRRETYYYPTKTELRLKDQQLQIIQTFDDGTQRLFYLDENHQGFTEDLGEPIKKADKFIIKNHSDPDKTILRRNEYIGDLNGTHLILQPNCKLQLLNKNKTIWSFSADFSQNVPCTLDIAQDNTIKISRRWMDETVSEDSVIGSERIFEVVESKITIEESEPIITQTLKNGSELTFYGGRLKREPTQIAQGTSRIPRMGYVGNLTGLHLILEHNCSFMLVNGDEKLWEFQRGPRDSSNAALECSVELEDYCEFLLFIFPHEPEYLLEHSSSTEFAGVEITLENDQIIVKRKRRDRDQPDIFYAGRQTNGNFFQFIAQNSIVANRNSSFVEILPKMGYIGDLNGVYVLLDQNCNLVLYNKTRLLWESGTFLDQTSTPWQPCGLGVGLYEDMQVKISAPISHNRYDERETIWSAIDFRPHANLGQILKAELSIVKDELWLTYTFQDGTVKIEKAMKGTNHFTNNLAQFQPPPHPDEEKMVSCMGRNATQPLNYRGKNLTSNNNDPQDVVLCLGDTFGDLNETYVTLEYCSLTMYHKDKRIWSSNKQEAPTWSEDCVFSLERDGNLVLYGESVIYPNPGNSFSVPYRIWDSQTTFNPVKSELTIQDQQVKMIQTFGDGTQRIFYGDANHQEFREYLGEPTKVADKFIIKSHQDEDKTILRRNEYIGDLKGAHLILQPNCQLQLLNKNRTIWSFIPPFRHTMNCTLNVAQDGTIEISRALPDIKVDHFDEEQWKNGEKMIYGRESLIKHIKPQKVLESQITFEDHQPMIFQTLENGSKLTFCGMSGQNSGLSPKKELTQISPKTIVLRNDYSEKPFLKRMDYIGNLTGLHLILEQNCSLILANGNKKLWEFQSESHYTDDPLIDCSVALYFNREMVLTKEFVRVHHQERQSLIEFPYLSERDKAHRTITLENDQIIAKQERREGPPDIFYAGSKTNGSFFQFLAERSVIINLDRSSKDILPKMGYIGDLNGVYTILDKKCNWILYNKTQVLWDSGTYVESGNCYLYQSDNGELTMTGMRESPWSAFGSSAHKGSFKKLLRVEVFVDNSGLWLIQMFRDGTKLKYKAIIGTNHFELISQEYEKSFGLEL